MAKLSNQSSNGTSFHNSTITASVNELIKVLGEPQYQSNDGQDKVNFEWDCETEDGNVFTIYDWKEYRTISKNEQIEWHIGGNSGNVTSIAVDELEHLLNTVANEENVY
jgi:hypothetical protein